MSMDIFDAMNRFRPLSRKEKLAALIQYLNNGEDERAAEMLKRIGMLKRPAAGAALCAALEHCSAEVLRRLLAHVPRGEYAASIRVGRQAWTVQGTLPTLAAALGRAEHLRLLLDWGCDVNSASLDAATALHNIPGGAYVGALRCVHGHRAVAAGSAVFRPGHGFQSCIYGITPLAAAAAFGHISCVQTLLERENVWRTECPAVSEALALHGEPWDVTGAHRECRAMIRALPDGGARPLLLCAAVRHMNEITLRDELCCCVYDREEIVHTALALLAHGLLVPEKSAQRSMLAVLAGRYPDAMRDERVTRRLAAKLWVQDESLPEPVQNLLGETVDLDEIPFESSLRSAALEAKLHLFGGSRRLVMSRDRIGTDLGLNASCLQVLIRRVTFRPSSLPIGVSGLTGAILRSGDGKLVREALERGVIPAEEPLDRLLELAGKSAAVRALLLTSKRAPLGSAAPAEERCTSRELTAEDAEHVLRDPALRAQASDALLEQIVCERQQRRTAFLRIGDFITQNESVAFVLCGETELALRLLRHHAWEANGWLSLNFVWSGAKDVPLCLPPLSCAAAAGQTETAAAILDAGYDPEGQDMGFCGNATVYDRGNAAGEELVLSPLLCALLWEHWDTAALLLERGAVCDLTCYTVRRVFRVMQGGDVPYADIIRELGRYLNGRYLRKAE